MRINSKPLLILHDLIYILTNIVFLSEVQGRTYYIENSKHDSNVKISLHTISLHITTDLKYYHMLS